MNYDPKQKFPEDHISNTGNAETNKGKVALESYSKETISNKTALEGNPACIISIEKNTGNTMVRNQEIVRDADGNETRYYIYNIVNEDQNFSASASEFVPRRYLADEVDREISAFLKKNISKPEQIDNLRDAKVALLAGVIDRLDYLAIESRIKSTLSEQNVTTPEVTSIRNENFIPDQRTERVIENINKKYLTDEIKMEIRKFNSEVLSELPNSFFKLINNIIEINNLNDRTIQESMISFRKVYNDEVSPKLLEANKFLGKFSSQEIYQDMRRLDSEIANLESYIAGTIDENMKNIIREKIKKVEETKTQLEDFRRKILSLENELRNLARSIVINFLNLELKQQTLEYRIIQQAKDEIHSYTTNILRVVGQ